MSASEPRRQPGTARDTRHHLPSSLTQEQLEKLALLYVHLVLADLRRRRVAARHGELLESL